MDKELTPLEQAQADIQSVHDHLIAVMNQRDKLVAALVHAIQRNHGFQPEACDGCAEAEKALKIQ